MGGSHKTKTESTYACQAFGEVRPRDKRHSPWPPPFTRRRVHDDIQKDVGSSSDRDPDDEKDEHTKNLKAKSRARPWAKNKWAGAREGHRQGQGDGKKGKMAKHAVEGRACVVPILSPHVHGVPS